MKRIEKRWLVLRASHTYVRGRRQCKVCYCWIHKKMETCQPCVGSVPELSRLHRF